MLCLEGGRLCQLCLSPLPVALRGAREGRNGQSVVSGKQKKLPGGEQAGVGMKAQGFIHALGRLVPFGFGAGKGMWHLDAQIGGNFLLTVFVSDDNLLIRI